MDPYPDSDLYPDPDFARNPDPAFLSVANKMPKNNIFFFQSFFAFYFLKVHLHSVVDLVSGQWIRILIRIWNLDLGELHGGFL